MLYCIVGVLWVLHSRTDKVCKYVNIGKYVQTERLNKSAMPYLAKALEIVGHSGQHYGVELYVGPVL